MLRDVAKAFEDLNKIVEGLRTEIEEVTSVAEFRRTRMSVLMRELRELKAAVTEMKPAADPQAQDEIERLRGELAAAEAERESIRAERSRLQREAGNHASERSILLKQLAELRLQESLLKERVRVQDSQRTHQLERHDRILAKYREVKRESLQRGIDLEEARRQLAAVDGPQSPAAPSEDSYLAEELAKARTDLAILVAAVASLTHAYKSSGSAAMCLWCSSSDPDAPQHRTVSRLFAEKK